VLIPSIIIDVNPPPSSTADSIEKIELNWPILQTTTAYHVVTAHTEKYFFIYLLRERSRREQQEQ